MSTDLTDNNTTAEVQFHDSSYVDTNLRLFRWRDELYRGATQLYADFYRKFLNSDVAQGLMKDGLLVRTEITEHRHSGFDLILKHKTLPVVTYPYEWSFDALKDAAQLTLEIQERLLRAGLRLHDPHPWNILFDGTRPVFVDIGAISDERDGRGAPALAFRSFYLNPLRLISVDQGRIARSLLASPDMQGVTDEEAFAVLEGLQGERFSRRLFAAARWALPPSARRAIKASFRTVAS